MYYTHIHIHLKLYETILYMYIYVYICIHLYTYIYIYIVWHNAVIHHRTPARSPPPQEVRRELRPRGRASPRGEPDSSREPFREVESPPDRGPGEPCPGSSQERDD